MDVAHWFVKFHIDFSILADVVLSLWSQKSAYELTHASLFSKVQP